MAPARCGPGGQRGPGRGHPRVVGVRCARGPRARGVAHRLGAARCVASRRRGTRRHRGSRPGRAGRRWHRPPVRRPREHPYRHGVASPWPRNRREPLRRTHVVVATSCRRHAAQVPVEGVVPAPGMEPGRAARGHRRPGLHGALLDHEEREGPADVGLPAQGAGTVMGFRGPAPCHGRRTRGDRVGLLGRRARGHRARGARRRWHPLG